MENKTFIGSFVGYRGYYGTQYIDKSGNLWGYLSNIGGPIEYKIEGDSLSKLYEAYKNTVDKYIEDLKAKELAKPLLKIDIEWSMCTDGDYRLDNADKYDIYTGYESYSGNKVFTSSNDDVIRREAVSFLEELLCDIRYKPSHHYVMKYMYEIFEKSISFISKGDNYGCNIESVGGNYDGTTIHINITRIERDEEKE